MPRKSRRTPSTSSKASANRHVKRALGYARDVVAGRIPACHWVKQACRRQLDDLKRWAKSGPYEFDAALAGEWCEFVELLPHIKGPKAGQNIVLEPWQCFVITTVFGWLRRGTRYRRFRRSYTEEPRGNAKSTLTAALELKAAFADNEGGAEVYNAAVTRDQARIVFELAQHMARQRPELCDALGVEVLAHAIVQHSTASKVSALASESNSLDGLNISFAGIDELHAHPTRAVYDALETGTGKRPQSMLWVITTAGSDQAGICYEVRSYVTKILNGVVADEAVFGIIYTIDDEDQWVDESSWIKANPNWGVSVEPDTIRELAQKAIAMPAAQSSFKTKHLDVWVNADMAWMNMLHWRRGGDPGLTIEDFRGQPCLVGLDLASKTDLAARIALFWRDLEAIRHYYIFGRYFLPEEALRDGRNSQYSGWGTAGLITTTPGETLDFSVIEEDLIALSSAYEVREIAYDPWQATQLASRMEAQGALMVEYRNTVANFSAPMKEIDGLVRSGQLHHDGDPALEWMVSNVVCHVDAKDNIYPRKERLENKIDGVVALISAMGRALAVPENPVFEGKLLVL